MKTLVLAGLLGLLWCCGVSGCSKSGKTSSTTATPQDAIRTYLKADLAQRNDELLEEVAWYEPVETSSEMTISKLGAGGTPGEQTKVSPGSLAIRLEFRTKKELLEPSIYRNKAKNYDMVFILPKGASKVAGSLPTKFATGDGKLLGKSVDWKTQSNVSRGMRDRAAIPVLPRLLAWQVCQQRIRNGLLGEARDS